MAKKKQTQEQPQEKEQEKASKSEELKFTETETPLDSELENKKDIEEYLQMVLAKINDGRRYYEDVFHDSWEELASLYEGIRQRTEEMQDWQNNLAPNNGFGLIRQQLALYMNTLYPKRDNYTMKPRKYVEDKAKAKKTVEFHKEVMDIQSKQMHEYRNFTWLVLDSLIFSSGKCDIGWHIDYRDKRYYLNTKTGKKEELKIERISRPYIRILNPFDVIIDPDCDAIEDDINGAEYGAIRDSITVRDLKESPRYNVKSEVTRFLRDNPKLKNWDRLERWEFRTRTERAMVITGINDTAIPSDAGGGYLVSKHYTPYKDNKLHILSMVAYSKQRSVEALSTMMMVRDSLKYITKIVNSNADAMDLALLGLWMLKSDSDIPFDRAKIFPSKVFKVNSFDELKKMDVTAVHPDAYREIELHEKMMRGVTGNLDAVNVRPETKTATEAKIEASRNSVKTKEDVKFNKEEFYVEYLRQRIDLNQQFLTKDDAIALVGERRMKELEIEPDDVDWNVDLDIELTGELADIDRVNEADKINNFVAIVQAVASLPDAFDKVEMLKELMNMFGYPEKWIQEQKPQEQKQLPAGKEQPQQPTPEDVQAKEQVVSGIEQEVEQMARDAGKSPEDLINGIATQLQAKPEQILEQAVQAGGLGKFLQTINGGQ